MANALGVHMTFANFLPVNATDLLAKYLGDSEKNIRNLFSLARRAQPCIVFIDELDAIASTRRDDDPNGAADRRILGALLTYVTESR